MGRWTNDQKELGEPSALRKQSDVCFFFLVGPFFFTLLQLNYRTSSTLLGTKISPTKALWKKILGAAPEIPSQASEDTGTLSPARMDSKAFHISLMQSSWSIHKKNGRFIIQIKGEINSSTLSFRRGWYNHLIRIPYCWWFRNPVNQLRVVALPIN